MKTIKIALILLVSAAVVTSCRDRAAEKRIAELEAHLAAVEGGKTDPGVNPAAGQAAAATPAAPAAEQKPEGPLPAIQFEKVDHDFGTIAEGQKIGRAHV